MSPEANPLETTVAADADGPPASGDALAALAAIHERGERVRQQELDTALRKLDDLDDEQRDALESLSERLVTSVLDPPTRSLLAAAHSDDEAVATALSLFEDGERDEQGSDRSIRGESPPGRVRVRGRQDPIAHRPEQ